MSGQNQSKSTVTKSDIVEKVYEKIGFSKKEASDYVELVFNSLKEVLEKGEKVKISGFGNFSIRDKSTRVGRNPQTGETIQIASAKIPSFKPGKALKDSVN